MTRLFNAKTIAALAAAAFSTSACIPIGGNGFEFVPVNVGDAALFDTREWFELRSSLRNAADALEGIEGAGAVIGDIRTHADSLDTALAQTGLQNYTQPDNPAALWKVRAQELHVEGYRVARDAGLVPPLSVTRRLNGVGWYSTWWDFSSP